MLLGCRMWMMVEPCVPNGPVCHLQHAAASGLSHAAPHQCYMRPGDDVPICPEGIPDHLEYALIPVGPQMPSSLPC